MKVVRFEVTMRIHERPDFNEAQATQKVRYSLMNVEGVAEVVQLGPAIEYGEAERRPEIAAL